MRTTVNVASSGPHGHTVFDDWRMAGICVSLSPVPTVRGEAPVVEAAVLSAKRVPVIAFAGTRRSVIKTLDSRRTDGASQSETLNELRSHA